MRSSSAKCATCAAHGLRELFHNTLKSSGSFVRVVVAWTESAWLEMAVVDLYCGVLDELSVDPRDCLKCSPPA